jgi:hypothetical protein
MENCLNCGTPLEGEYCHKCGQKRIGPGDRTVIKFLQNFFEESFAFDAKFFRSMRLLLSKPGFLTSEYVNGRVASYVSPLKMYLFISVVTFLVTSYVAPDTLESVKEDMSFLAPAINSILETKHVSYQILSERFSAEYNGKLPLYIIAMIILFSLPLKLIYITKKRRYVEHLVFTLHFYSFVMFSIMFSTFVEIILPDFVILSFLVIPFFYLVLAIYHVYEQNLILSFFESIILFIYYVFLLLSGIIGAILITVILI